MTQSYKTVEKVYIQLELFGTLLESVFTEKAIDITFLPSNHVLLYWYILSKHKHKCVVMVFTSQLHVPVSLFGLTSLVSRSGSCNLNVCMFVVSLVAFISCGSCK
uniref:Uncharacterized protein n=1 Tax=Octopus bimaculoides TaxID=37653 RepID=A0A0L8FX80_OCTBM